MLKILAVAPAQPDAPTLVTDLESNGLQVCARCTCVGMVREAVRHAPDMVIVWDPHPGEELFEATRLLESATPAPVLVFTSDVRAETMETAIASGIDGWVVNGYAAGRLRPLIQFTSARHRQMRQMREELGDLKRRLEERKLVDRAKGILMSARQISEDEAFRLLRSASMHAKLRIGQVSQQVIDSAHYAEAINRAGRLRMLSQRIVKLFLFADLATGCDIAALIERSAAEFEANLAELLRDGRALPEVVAQLDEVAKQWRRLLGALAPSVDRPRRSQQARLVTAEGKRLLRCVDTVVKLYERLTREP